jgi:hypothetical protein
MERLAHYLCKQCNYLDYRPEDADIPLCYICKKDMQLFDYSAPEKAAEDTPINPKHYWSDSFECIDIAEDMSFNMGNALKYIWRAGKKDPKKTVEDLKKAQWYVEREITRLERTETKK